MTAHRPTHRTTGARLGLIAVVGLTLALSSVAGTGVLPAGAAPVTALMQWVSGRSPLNWRVALYMPAVWVAVTSPLAPSACWCTRAG